MRHLECLAAHLFAGLYVIMDMIESMKLAEEIAAAVIDKSYWGDQWFLLFCLLIVGLIASISAWGGAYLSTRAQNSAMRADFQKALANLEDQTKSVKRIEEDISHNYLEAREVARIRREKIELLYLALDSELKQYIHNFRVVASDASEDVVAISFTAEMLASLYFKQELKDEIKYYREQRNALSTRIRALSEENMLQPGKGSVNRLEQNQTFITNYNQAKINIELKLEKMMKELISCSTLSHLRNTP